MKWAGPALPGDDADVRQYEGQLYVSTTGTGPNKTRTGDLLALDANSGAINWTYRVSASAASDGGFDCWRFELADNTIYALVSAYPGFGPGPGNILALDAQQGTKIWDHQLDPWFGPRDAVLAVSANVLCAAIATAAPHGGLNLDCTGLGLDRAKGTQLWAYDTKMSEVEAFTTGSMAGNVMFLGETNEGGGASTSTGGVVALDLRDGTRKWTYALSDMIEGTPVVARA